MIPIIGAGLVAIRTAGSAMIRGAPAATARTAVRVLDNKYLNAISHASTTLAVAEELFVEEDLVPAEVEAILFDISAALGLKSSVDWIRSSGISSVLAKAAAMRGKKVRKYVRSYPRPQQSVKDVRGRNTADLSLTWPKRFDKASSTWVVTDAHGKGIFTMSREGMSYASDAPTRLKTMHLAGGTAAAAASLFTLTDSQGVTEASEYLDYLMNVMFDTSEIPNPERDDMSEGESTVSIGTLIRHPDWTMQRIAYQLDTSVRDVRVQRAYATLLRDAILQPEAITEVSVHDSTDIAEDVSEDDYLGKVATVISDLGDEIVASGAFEWTMSALRAPFDLSYGWLRDTFEVDESITVESAPEDGDTPKQRVRIDAMPGNENYEENTTVGAGGSARFGDAFSRLARDG